MRAIRMRGAAVAAFALMTVAATAAVAGDYRISKSFELAPGASFSLRSEGGGVTVHGGDGTTAVIVITSTRSDFAELYDVRFEQPGADRLDVTIERRGHGLRWGGSGSTHVDVSLPRTSSAELHSSGGGIEVTDLDGRLRAESSGGSVTIESIGGDVVLSSSGGGVHVRGVGGEARVRSSGGSVELRDVAGDIDSSSSGGGVRIENAGGVVAADSSGGPVRVSFAAGNSKGGDLHSSGGGVHVALDRAAALDIDASASGGGVSCDLPITIRGRVTRDRLSGQVNGGGPLLKLRSSGGGITIEER